MKTKSGGCLSELFLRFRRGREKPEKETGRAVSGGMEPGAEAPGGTAYGNGMQGDPFFAEDSRWMKRQLSHNVRMPMAVISGYGDLLKKGNFATREEEIACIGKICSNIEYLNTFLKVALDDFPETGQDDRDFFDVLSCAREVAGYVRSMAARMGVSIDVNSSRSEVLLWGRRLDMMRVFYNLFENSLKYMKRKGGIFITVEENPGEVMVIYRDEGEGMNESEAEKITEPLYRGSNAQEPGGHGIGMYLVRRIVEDNGGSICIRTGKEKGMCIYMSFPIGRTEERGGINPNL